MTKYGTMYKQREIVIVPFPFSDLSSIKQRPVLILSKNRDNEESEDILVCGITSNPKQAKYSIVFDNAELEEGKIPRISRIKVDKLFSLDKRTIKKKVGKLSERTFVTVREEFRKLV